MNRCLFTLLFFISSTLLYAQRYGKEKIDSLTAELNNVKTDSLKANLLNRISEENITISNYSVALSTAQQALQLSEKNGFKNEMVASHGHIALIHKYQGDYINTLEHLGSALSIREELEDKTGIADIYNNMGVVYLEQGDYTKALENHFLALKTYEEVGDREGVASTNENIGSVYHLIGDFEKSLEYDLAALKKREEVGDLLGLLITYINVGTTYGALEKYTEAENIFLKALEIAKNNGDRYREAIIYTNIGHIYKELEDYAQAEKNYFKSLHIAEEIDSKYGMVAGYADIGNLYLTLHRNREAKEWLQKSLSFDKDVPLEHAMKSYQSLSEAYSRLGNHKNSLENYKLYVKYKDSLFNEENTRKLTQTEMNYEFEKTQDSIRLVNEMEIAVRDASIANVRRQRWFFIGGLFALGLIGGLLYYQSRQRQRHNEKLRTLNAELDQANRIKTRFFSILNHDLRGPVSNLIHFLHLKKENPELLDEETKDRLEQKTTKGAENLLVTMEDLLLWSKGQMENFEPQPKKITVDQLFADTRKVFSGYQNIQFEYHDPDAVELFTDEDYLKTIIRNLTSNAINVFTTTQNPRIIWKASLQNGKAMLSITDNGPGADSEKFKALYDDKEVVGIKSGLGLHLIRDLAKAIDCEIEVDTAPEKGTIIKLIF